METQLPPGLTKANLDNFILRTWNRTAYLAYKGYLLHGRGLVNWHWKSGDFTMQGFVTKQEVLSKGFADKCVQIIENYDPKNHAVLGISWEIGDNLYDSFVMQVKITNMPSPVSIYSAQNN